MSSGRMADRFRVTLAQLNPTVGDLAGNAAKARAAWEEGRKAGADLVALPEMFITGYNTQDLVMKPVFHQAAIAEVEKLAADCADGPALAIGGPWVEGGRLYNAYLILKGGKIASRSLKHHLPNETVFDEVRIFEAGPLGGPYAVGNTRIGSPICEDGWHEDVAETLAETGAEFLLIPNGSPYFRNKMEVRFNMNLGKPAAEIRIGDVFRDVEGNLPMVECFADADNTCPLSDACRLKVALADAAQAFYASLDDISLESLVCDNHDLLRILQPVSCGAR